MYLFIYIWILYLWAPHIQNGLKVGPILEKTLILFHTVPTHKTKASAYYSQETKEGYHLLIPQSLNFLSPPHLLLPSTER